MKDNSIVAQYQDSVVGTLSGWDRLIFRGYMSMFATAGGILTWLSHIGVLVKDFSEHAKAKTEELKKEWILSTGLAGRPYRYLNSSQLSKEQTAWDVFRKDPVETGLICSFGCVEPCRTFQIAKVPGYDRIELRKKIGKCLHLYKYWMDREFGFVSARIQTWYPFDIQIYINGREWLSKKMDARGMRYTRWDNSFPWIDDFHKAQKLMNQSHRKNWIRSLNRILKFANRSHAKMFPTMEYYWTAFQTEWATDICFDSPGSLQAIYTPMVRGAMTALSAKSVLRFMGKRMSFQGEVTGDYRHRAEGIRIKHAAGGNSIKAYDKGGQILRIETTINRPYHFRVFRPKQNGPADDLQWRLLRKSVVDMKRRAEVSQRANDRYADSLATLDTSKPAKEIVATICRRARHGKTRYRSLRPWSTEDRALLEAVNRGEWITHGFANNDIAQLLYPTASKDSSRRKQLSSRVSYRLRILRAHGVIRKIKGRRRYNVTHKGREIINTVLLTQNATLQQLNALAA